MSPNRRLRDAKPRRRRRASGPASPPQKLDREVQDAVNRLTARQRKLWRDRGFPNSLKAIARIVESCPMSDGRPKR